MSNVLATQEAKYFPSLKVAYYCWKAIHLRAMLLLWKYPPIDYSIRKNFK